MFKQRAVFQLAIDAFTNLKANDPIRMAGATAFFTFFALPAIVILLSQLYGEVLSGDKQWVSGQLFNKLAELFGAPSARQLKDISQHLQRAQSKGVSMFVFPLVLLLASTTLFAIIKNSLNQLWNVKPSAQRHWWYVFLDRLVALGLILFLGLLFTASLGLQQLGLTQDTAEAGHTNMSHWIHQIQQHLWSVLMLTLWFSVVFKYLPDIRIHWQAVWVGGLVTGVLVEVGEQVLDRLLINSPVRELYGSAGAITLVLLFVFYSALILYYGASFTRQYALWKKLDTRPNARSEAYQIKVVDEQDSSLNE